ncbi:MAG: glucokinase, partial [Microbacteriaceae bacterium]|nr:glucokinase [Burkholderiaceae bacterium]
ADRFFASAFRLRFEAKGRFHGYLAAIPTALITDTLAALSGAALAIEQHLEQPAIQPAIQPAEQPAEPPAEPPAEQPSVQRAGPAGSAGRRTLGGGDWS